jgi:hypothetical protein
MIKNKRECIDKIASRLKELESEISELEKIAVKAEAEVKAEYHQQIKYLFLKKEKLQNTVAKIREASGNAWEDMKAGTELSWEVFQDSVESIKRKR